MSIEQRDRRDDEEDVGDEVDDVVDDPARRRRRRRRAIVASTVAIAPAAAPSSSDRRAPQTTCEKTSLSLVGRAEEVVQRRCLARVEEREVGRRARAARAAARSAPSTTMPSTTTEPDARLRVAEHQQRPSPARQLRLRRRDDRRRGRQLDGIGCHLRHR